MHEVAAMRGAVSTVLARMHTEGATRITRVQLMLGVSGHISEEAARQHFALLAAGTPIEDAQLDISWLPATYQCFECLHQFESALPLDTVRCPKCDGLALEVAHSNECYAREIDVEDVAGALAT